jgi:hypothetical protein
VHTVGILRAARIGRSGANERYLFWYTSQMQLGAFLSWSWDVCLEPSAEIPQFGSARHRVSRPTVLYDGYWIFLYTIAQQRLVADAMVVLWHLSVSCPSGEEDGDTVVDLRQAGLLPQHRDFIRQGNLSNSDL